MARLSKILIVLAALSCLGATWISSPGKGSHASAAVGAAFRSISGTTYASRTNTVITAPSGITNGDILLIAAYTAGDGPENRPTPTFPAGFTIIQGPAAVVDSGGSFGVTRTLAWKLASSESGSYTLTHISTISQAVMVCISGAANATPVSSDNSGTGTTTTATGVTTPSNNSLVVFISQAWANYGSASPPSGSTPTFTERYDDSGGIVYVATGVLATAGATSNKTHTNLNAAGEPWSAWLVAVGP